MPDDIKVIAGLGDDTVAPPVATDLVGGKHYQKVKFGFGVDGAWIETADVTGSRIPVTNPVFIAATVTDGGTGAAGANGTIVGTTAGSRFCGFSMRETTGSAPALVIIHHGSSTAGVPLVIVSLGSNESVREWYGPDGMAAASGIFIERVSGTSQIVVYSKVVP